MINPKESVYVRYKRRLNEAKASIEMNKKNIELKKTTPLTTSVPSVPSVTSAPVVQKSGGCGCGRRK